MEEVTIPVFCSNCGTKISAFISSDSIHTEPCDRCYTIERNKRKKVENLLRKAYEQLNFCGYGDKYEREVSVDLRRHLDDYFHKLEKSS